MTEVSKQEKRKKKTRIKCLESVFGTDTTAAVKRGMESKRFWMCASGREFRFIPMCSKSSSFEVLESVSRVRRPPNKPTNSQ